MQEYYIQDDITGFLDEWFTRIISSDQYTICGYCYGNPRFPNGTWVRTDIVTTPIEDCTVGALIKTLNSTYKLGRHSNPLTGDNN